MLRKKCKFKFGVEQKTAFEIIKQKLCNDPVLKLYNPDLETELHTACQSGFGGCLLQRQLDDQKMHPVFYISFKTSESESRLSIYALKVRL